MLRRDAKPWGKHRIAPAEIANRRRFREPAVTEFLDREAPSFCIRRRSSAFEKALMMEPFLIRRLNFMCPMFVVAGVSLGARAFGVSIFPKISTP